MPRILSMYILRERSLNNQSFFRINNKYKNQNKKFLLTVLLFNFIVVSFSLVL